MIGTILEMLIKENDGKFVSSKQACKLLGQCHLTKAGYVFNDVDSNGISIRYLCDGEGIVSVTNVELEKQATIWSRS